MNLDVACKLAGFLALNESDDLHTQVGCVLLDRYWNVCGIGANTALDCTPERPEEMERPNKYTWIPHAEVNAALNLQGRCVRHGTAVTTWFPCLTCAQVLVSLGVRTLACSNPDREGPEYMARYGFDRSRVLLAQAGVRLSYHSHDLLTGQA